MLCALSKTLERIVHKQTTKYLINNNLLINRQTGFREGMGTQTAVLRFTDDIRMGIDVGEVTIAVFFDFTKAFDTVNHLLLLRKLFKLGFSLKTIRWYYSYLKGRLQSVLANNTNSEWINLDSGVPQGSVLGPLLFSLFINDLPNCLRHSLYLLYADDLVIYRRCKIGDINETIELINSDIKSISDWCNLNKLKQNMSKTKSMVFGSTINVCRIHIINEKSNGSLLRLYLDNSIIEFVNTYKYLGVILDNTLNWSSHIANIKKRAAFALSRLRMNDSNLSIALKRKLVVGLVLPTFDYCNCVLTNLTYDNERSLLLSLNNCVRFVMRVGRYRHISDHRRHLGWLVPKNRRLQLISCEFYKALCLMRPGLFSEQLVLRLNIASRRNHDRADTLQVPFAYTTSYQKSFIVTGCNFWNSLPFEITSSETFDEFKNKVYIYLLDIEERERL